MGRGTRPSSAAKDGWHRAAFREKGVGKLAHKVTRPQPAPSFSPTPTFGLLGHIGFCTGRALPPAGSTAFNAPTWASVIVLGVFIMKYLRDIRWGKRKGGGVSVNDLAWGMTKQNNKKKKNLKQGSVSYFMFSEHGGVVVLPL